MPLAAVKPRDRFTEHAATEEGFSAEWWTGTSEFFDCWPVASPPIDWPALKRIMHTTLEVASPPIDWPALKRILHTTWEGDWRTERAIAGAQLDALDTRSGGTRMLVARTTDVELWLPEAKTSFLRDYLACFDSTEKAKTDLFWALHSSHAILEKLGIYGIEQRYDLRDRARVLRFLEGNMQLIGLLNEATRFLDTLFPRAGVSLEIVDDPETSGFQQAVVYLNTSQPPEEALAKLAEFDEAWWFGAMDGAEGKLCFTLEFG